MLPNNCNRTLWQLWTSISHSLIWRHPENHNARIQTLRDNLRKPSPAWAKYRGKVPGLSHPRVRKADMLVKVPKLVDFTAVFGKVAFPIHLYLESTSQLRSLLSAFQESFRRRFFKQRIVFIPIMEATGAPCVKHVMTSSHKGLGRLSWAFMKPSVKHRFPSTRVEYSPNGRAKGGWTASPSFRDKNYMNCTVKVPLSA